MAKLWSLTLSVLVAIILQDKVIGFRLDRNFLNVTAGLFRESERLSYNTVGIQCEKENDWDEDQYCVCPKGNRISQFVSVHDNGKEDRKWTLECAEIPNFIETNANYPSSSLTNAWDGDFAWYGGDDAFLVGMKSYHDNGKEDRKYTMFYTRSDNWQLKSCSDWHKLNHFDDPVSVYLGDFKVISAVKSNHNNGNEDREWHIKICTLVHKCSEIIDITYDVANKEVLETGDVTAGVNRIDNSGSTVETKYTVSISQSNQETLTSSYEFQSSTTLSVDTSMTISAGAAVKIFTASRELGISLGISTSNTLSSSETSSYSETHSQELSYEVICPAKAECEGTILVKQEKSSVPYEITRQSPGSTETCVETGNLITSNAFDAEFIAVSDKNICG